MGIINSLNRKIELTWYIFAAYQVFSHIIFICVAHAQIRLNTYIIIPAFIYFVTLQREPKFYQKKKQRMQDW